MAEIIFKDVDVVYLGRKKQEFLALDKLSLTFESGKINAVIGYSGCGKTTILRAVTGQVNYGGSITYDGKEIDEISALEKNLSIVHQNYSLYPRMTVFDNLAFPLKMLNYSPDEIDNKVYEMANFLGIKHCLTRKPKELSGGQQQKVALGRSLIKRPNTILFDEPLSNIDQENRIELLKLIKSLPTLYGTTCIYVTHNINEVYTLADNVYIINEGKCICRLKPNELLESKNEIVLSLLKSTKENEK